MSYPDRPLRIITSTVRGSADFAAQVIARGLTLALGQPVSVENHPNAAIPINAVSRAAPDGYTLLVSGGALWMAREAGRAPFSDFTPITCLSSAPNVLVVHPELPVDSVNELIALARQKPGELVYSSGGKGSSSYLAGELIKRTTGVELVYAAYKDSAEMLQDLLNGRVQVLFGTAGVVTPHIKAGRLKALAVTSREPTKLFPGIPTVAASDLPGFESTTRIGFFAPAGTPSAIIERLNRESLHILQREEIQAELLTAGMDAGGGSPEEFLQLLQREIETNGIKD